jgi:uncharacterized protein (DUF1778 family)
MKTKSLTLKLSQRSRKVIREAAAVMFLGLQGIAVG